MKYSSRLAAAYTACSLLTAQGKTHHNFKPSSPFTHTVIAKVVISDDIYTPSELIPRAFPANAPNGYTPQSTNCPSTPPTIRVTSGLSDNETAWLSVRRNATITPMRDLLARMNISGLDTDQYINTHMSNASALPNIGIAISGGGYRAMLNGAGVIEAFDSRTPNSTSKGQVGGLLQASTYLSGLSGGSWLVGSLYTNNFTSISNILSSDTNSTGSGDLWQFGNSIFQGPETGGIQLLGMYLPSALYETHADVVFR